MAPDTAPLAGKLEADFAATAAGDAQATVIGEAPFDLTVTAITAVFEADVTGATATKRTFTVVDKGLDGNGATVVGTLDFTTGVDALDFDEIAFTLGNEAAVEVAAGAVLAVVEAVTSTGTVNPGGKVTVEYTRGQD